MRTNLWLCVLSVLFFGACNRPEAGAPVEVTWKMGENGIEKGYYDNTFVIRNVSVKPLDAGWTIYYAQLPHVIRQDDDTPVKIEPVNGCYYKMYPTSRYRELLPGDSLAVTFRCSYALIKNSHAPEGMYMVLKEGERESAPVAVTCRTLPLKGEKQWSRPGVRELPYPDGETVYKDNMRFEGVPDLENADILPSVKKWEKESGETVITGRVVVSALPDFENEKNYLEEQLPAKGIVVAPEAAVNIMLENLPEGIIPVNDEFYRLQIADGKVRIQGNTTHGVFNGIQTFLSLMKGKALPYELENMVITDYPDLSYRGVMIDIARNYTAPENLMKLLDILSSYKLNVLHFHFSDDEAWRLEIPGLEELTEVGARRGHTLDERNCLYPAYDGCFDPEDTLSSSNGYYTRQDFVALLQHARARHIQVIPEIESPGHARAAIVSMKARYEKYKDVQPDKAQEYLLSDFADTSVYYSAQAYTDNVMNAALPSVYRFFGKVTDELIEMYAEAGVPLLTIHIGGDEVPEGVWMGSPECRKLMTEQQMEKPHDLSEYFLKNITAMLEAKGISTAGWQEAALGHDAATDREVRERFAGVYCWETLPWWGGDEVPYRLANNGYPVILCNVNNFYLDMAYNKHPDEPGLYWGGFNTEYTSFNMLPYDIYRSSRQDASGLPVDLEKAGAGKVNLTEKGAAHIVGVQGQLFSETIRNYDMVEYYLFPKIFGLVERGWNASPEWSKIRDAAAEEQAYRKALRIYHAKITGKEMPFLIDRDVNFRIAQPGLHIENGKLYANSPIPSAQIRYTLDGSDPDENSALWSAPVAYASQPVKARLFYGGRASVVTELKR